MRRYFVLRIWLMVGNIMCTLSSGVDILTQVVILFLIWTYLSAQFNQIHLNNLTLQHHWFPMHVFILSQQDPKEKVQILLLVLQTRMLMLHQSLEFIILLLKNGKVTESIAIINNGSMIQNNSQ